MTTTCDYWGGRSASLREGRSATWSAWRICEMAHLLSLSLESRNLWNDTFDSRNVKLPLRSTGRSTWGVDLPVDLNGNFRFLLLELILADQLADRGVDLSVDLPIWARTVKIWNCHSHPLANILGGGRSPKYEFPDVLLCSSQRSFRFV